MPKKKSFFDSGKSDFTMTPGKTNPINDGVKNAGNQQNTTAQLNMPRGAKKPRNTPK